jgi:hypothetical protein
MGYWSQIMGGWLTPSPEAQINAKVNYKRHSHYM